MDKNKRSESLAHGLYVSYGGFGHSGTLFMGGFFFFVSIHLQASSSNCYVPK